jgi:hypothetical protein
VVRKYQKGGPKLTSLPVIPYTVTAKDINSSAGANVKTLTPLQAYDFQRSIEKRKLQKKNEDILAQETKRNLANKTLKNGNVVSALLGQDHSGAKTKPIMIGNYNLANNPVMRAADGLVKTLYGNEPTVSALNNNDNYTFREILDAGATNAEGAYNTGNGVIDFLNPLNIANGVVQSWAKAPLEAQQSNSYLPYVAAAGNTFLAAGLPGTGKLLRYAAPEMMSTVDAAKRLYGRKLSKSYNNITTNTPLSNAYTYNPFRYKGSKDRIYTTIGEEGFQNAMQSKVIGAKQFTPKFNIAEKYGNNNYIAEVSKDATPFFKKPGNKGWLQQTPKDIPIDEARILKKHWWKGYAPENLEKYGLSNNPFIDRSPYFKEISNLENNYRIEHAKLNKLRDETWKKADKLAQLNSNYIDLEGQKLYNDNYLKFNEQEKLLKKKYDIITKNIEKKYQLGEFINKGTFGKVFLNPDNPNKVIKMGEKTSEEWTPELIEHAKKLSINNNLAIPTKAEYIKYNKYGDAKEILHMPNLNSFEGPVANLSERDKYALFLKQTRKLKDAGFMLDASNYGNFKNNYNKGIIDIYDIAPPSEKYFKERLLHLKNNQSYSNRWNEDYLQKIYNKVVHKI